MRGKRVEAGANIFEYLKTTVKRKRLGPEAVPETVAGRNKLWESVCVLAPGKATTVDHDASKCGAVTSNPLGGGVDDDVNAVIEGPAKEAAGAEGVVDLCIISDWPFQKLLVD